VKVKEFIINYLSGLGFAHYYRHFIHGPAERLHWERAKERTTVNAIFNTRSGHIYIGKGTVIGYNCMFITGRHAFEGGKLKQPKSEQVPTQGYDIRIGAGSFITSGVTIIGGVTLGDNCIVAAGSVVTKSFPNGCILAGVPAKVIGYTLDREC